MAQPTVQVREIVDTLYATIDAIRAGDEYRHEPALKEKWRFRGADEVGADQCPYVGLFVVDGASPGVLSGETAASVDIGVMVVMRRDEARWGTKEAGELLEEWLRDVEKAMDGDLSAGRTHSGAPDRVYFRGHDPGGTYSRCLFVTTYVFRHARP